MRAAAKKYGIPKSTLKFKLKIYIYTKFLFKCFFPSLIWRDAHQLYKELLECIIGAKQVSKFSLVQVKFLLGIPKEESQNDEKNEKATKDEKKPDEDENRKVDELDLLKENVPKNKCYIKINLLKTSWILF